MVGGSVAYKVRLKTNTKDGEPFWLVLIGGQMIFFLVVPIGVIGVN